MKKQNKYVEPVICTNPQALSEPHPDQNSLSASMFEMLRSSFLSSVCDYEGYCFVNSVNV